MKGLSNLEKLIELEKRKIINEVVPILAERKKKNEKIISINKQRINGEVRAFGELFG
ncbi:hypothetical protein [Paraclostridium sordellii]|uniref:hypothetical protein n=1 Tax=Paraclostridium sordellii TaxID=1505 RepID=UPI0005DA94BC|nr:hypothetical protein [Paeniclostridium sordellii]CEP43494.1 Uncharacterised protein [[Clostridium] sordellii] [Paeniclostridium sordellii]